MEPIRLFLFLFLLVSSLLPFSTSIRCHPRDQNALLGIKNSFHNPPAFSTWTSNASCCNWSFVTCNPKTNRVTKLQIDNQTISGQIPSALGDLSNLEILIISSISNLTGEIPRSITNLRKLKNLQFMGVDISGSIPEFLGDLRELELLSLAFTKLSGEIPASLGNLTKLYFLSLEWNQLTGQIPESFANFKPKPSKGGFFLLLRGNKLSGKIPESLKKVHVRDLDLSYNKLTGDASMFFEASKPTLEIDLSRNMLEFDLSTVTFPQKIVEVDLSWNKINGKIPAQATKLTDLTYFDVSHNLLCGEIPQGGKMQRVGHFSQNLCLCGAPLAVKCKAGE